MNTEEKAAVLLKSLGAEVCDQVLLKVSPQIGDRLRGVLKRLESAPPAEPIIDEVLSEFDLLIGKMADEPPPVKKEPPKPAPPPAPKKKTTADLEASLTGDPLVDLAAMDIDRVGAALSQEQPRTVALLLSQFTTNIAGEMLKKLPGQLRKEVTLQLSTSMPVPKPVMERIAQAVVKKSLKIDLQGGGSDESARYKKMADMLRQLPKAERLDIMNALEEKDSVVASGVREHLYHFEDLLLVDDKSMQKLLAEVDSKSLGSALKGTNPIIADKVMANLSKRARESLTEEMEFLTNVGAGQIQQAQKSVVEVIQRLDQSGDLVMLEG